MNLVEIFGELGKAMDRVEGVESQNVSSERQDKGKGPVREEQSAEMNSYFLANEGDDSLGLNLDEGYGTQQIPELRDLANPPEGGPSSAGPSGYGRKSRPEISSTTLEIPYEPKTGSPLAFTQPEPPPSPPKKRRRRIRSGSTVLTDVRNDVEEYLQQQMQRGRAKGRHGAKVEDTQSTHSAQPRRSSTSPVKRSPLHPLLNVNAKDTPYTKALKLRRARLLREQKARSGKSRRDHLPRHSITPKRRATLAKRLQARPLEGSDGGVAEMDYSMGISEPDDGVSEQQDETDGSTTEPGTPAKPLPERNLEEYEKTVRAALPSAEIHPRTKDRVWNQQLKTWEKALDDRLWSGTVRNHRETQSAMDSVRPLIHATKHLQTDLAAQRRRKESEALRVVKASMREQKRRIVRMEKRQRDAESDVKRYKQKKASKDELLTAKLFDTYARTERQAILAERRAQKEVQKEQEKARKLAQESKENFYKSQIALLMEQLQEARREEEVVVKAHAEEMRRLLQDQKQAARTHIRRVKEKLEVDVEDMEFRELDAERVARDLMFAVRRRN
ncbi:hypothetical protein, variant [Spizellomyces punctatus DAOM BR117]|uniref:DUF5745 domain-containing protein n=2 Tax=Spizellomyces punctatus (strain DAOM BR117) TaxID=645134 RepID=A0A0L0HMT9_SPIPD|nr:hypothetical protein, variant [Spizellomyces punctatus DAOM BR117]KND02412.1 hypothetical protein, variant [Spizellomyces punctatus DAOM BR117]|eukprot:XP_016610451.1 hypothetical protein, variant [Spizellomyces punctatus DAOM BR117]